MKTAASCLLLALALTGCSSEPIKPTNPQAADVPYVFAPASGSADANDTALFLAGKPVQHGMMLSQLQNSGGYRSFSDEMRYRWRYYAARRTLRQSQWYDENIRPVIGSPSTVLYPFGGPDLLHAIAMFPHSSTYVLLGLESTGGVPPLESSAPDAVARSLSQLSRTVDTQLKVGYFITKDMRSDLNNGPLQGVTPVMLSSIALMGGTIENIQSISAGGKPGLQIDFRLPGAGSKRAIYVSADLSNKGFSGSYAAWLGQYSGSVAYFKAASYLMHDNNFSGIRSFVLSNTRAIVEDDSGIPYKYLSNGWEAKLFGSYNQPIELFTKFAQPDLRAAYAGAGATVDIPFGTGYQFRAASANLQVYKKQ